MEIYHNLSVRTFDNCPIAPTAQILTHQTASYSAYPEATVAWWQTHWNNRSWSESARAQALDPEHPSAWETRRNSWSSHATDGALFHVKQPTRLSPQLPHGSCLAWNSSTVSCSCWRRTRDRWPIHLNYSVQCHRLYWRRLSMCHCLLVSESSSGWPGSWWLFPSNLASLPCLVWSVSWSVCTLENRVEIRLKYVRMARWI